MRHWTSIRVSGKITECRSVVNPKTKNLLQTGEMAISTTCRPDNDKDHQFRTTAVLNSFPLWAEDFTIYLKNGILDLSIVIWGDFQSDKSGSSSNVLSPESVPIGKVVIPRGSICNGVEDWFLLSDASLETKVSGRINIKIEYSSKKKTHGFSVSVLRAKDLIAAHNPYVTLTLLPDSGTISIESTKILTNTKDPVFSEVFFFSCDEKIDLTSRTIHCTVWDRISEEYHPIFLGNCIIPLSPVISKRTTNRWYNLTALPQDSLWNPKPPPKRKLVGYDQMAYPKELTKIIQRNLNIPVKGERVHRFVEKSIVLDTCYVCSAKMIGSHLACAICNVHCHHKCQELSGTSCGGVGAIRVTLSIEKMTVLNLELYLDMIDLLQIDGFKIIIALGKVSQLRQEIALSCQSLFGNQYFEFVAKVVGQEIAESDNAKTLFRGNTLGSKALYAFMKTEGADYLRITLEETLQSIINSRKAFEIDSNKFDKMQEEQSVSKNMETMINYLDLVIQAILNSADKMPATLRAILSLIQEAAVKRFPGDESVRYTSVSGFLFLRFFNPAILSPKEYAMEVNLDSQSSRKLMLIGKTLQNLANLAGSKEKDEVMRPLNNFVTDRIPEIKNFIDLLKNFDPRDKELSTTTFDQEKIALDAARVHQILTQEKNQLVHINNYEQLSNVLASIEKSVLISEASQDFNPLDEIGTEIPNQELLPKSLRLSMHSSTPTMSLGLTKRMNLNLSSPNLFLDRESLLASQNIMESSSELRLSQQLGEAVEEKVRELLASSIAKPDAMLLELIKEFAEFKEKQSLSITELCEHQSGLEGKQIKALELIQSSFNLKFADLQEYILQSDRTVGDKSLGDKDVKEPWKVEFRALMLQMEELEELTISQSTQIIGMDERITKIPKQDLNKKLEAHVEALKSQIEDVEVQLKVHLKDDANKLTELKLQIEDIGARLGKNSKKDTNKQIETDVHTLKLQIEELGLQINRISKKETNKQIEADIQDLKSEIEDIGGQLLRQSKKDSNKQIDAEFQTLKFQIEDIGGQVLRYAKKESNTPTFADFDALKAHIEEAQVQIKRYSKKEGNLQLEADIDTLKNQIEEIQGQVIRYSKKGANFEMETELDTLKLNVEEIRGQLTKHFKRDGNKQIEVDFEELKLKFGDMEGLLLKQSKKEIKPLDNEVRDLRRDIEDIAAQVLRQSKKDGKPIEAEIRNLRLMIEEMEAQFSILTSRKDSSRPLEADVRALKFQLSEMEEQARIQSSQIDGISRNLQTNARQKEVSGDSQRCQVERQESHTSQNGREHSQSDPLDRRYRPSEVSLASSVQLQAMSKNLATQATQRQKELLAENFKVQMERQESRLSQGRENTITQSDQMDRRYRQSEVSLSMIQQQAISKNLESQANILQKELLAETFQAQMERQESRLIQGRDYYMLENDHSNTRPRQSALSRMSSFDQQRPLDATGRPSTTSQLSIQQSQRILDQVKGLSVSRASRYALQPSAYLSEFDRKLEQLKNDTKESATSRRARYGLE